MFDYFMRRILLMPVTLLGMTLLIFAITRLIPGGPLDLRLAQEQASSSTRSPVLTLNDEQMQSLRAYYGLDKPILKAYAGWLTSLIQGDLGSSLRYQEPVAKLMQSRLPVSLLFGFSSLLCSYGLCIVLALCFAFQPNHLLVKLTQNILLFFHAIPSSMMAIVLFFLVATRGYFPMGGLTSEDFADKGRLDQLFDILHHATLPLLAYCLHQMAVLTFILKDNLTAEMQGDAVQMARAKGASRRQALLDHALPLALIPIVSQLGHQLSLVFAGSFLIERIFNLNGFGMLSFEALTERDYPLVIGLLAVAGLLHVLGNLLSDLCLSWADPRIRWTKDKAQ